MTTLVKLSPEKFLQAHRPWAQAHANAGRETLSLYRDSVGKPRLLLQGWPHAKSWILLGHVTPAPPRPTRPSGIA